MDIILRKHANVEDIFFANQILLAILEGSKARK